MDSDIQQKNWYFSYPDYRTFLSLLVNLTVPVIFLPTFETKRMVTRKDKRVRTIRRNTCRQMLDLSHYKFKIRLKWYAKKYGKFIVDCNEAYTSKTRSWDGTIDSNLGASKIIKGSGFKVHRDINASRNILIKHLSKAA